ncbi:MAG: peptidylprolyl isomerase [Saprospiraceae bacterium]|nr:peptidylprolyl isomerase [Candidatus Brachybacter algidus]
MKLKYNYLWLSILAVIVTSCIPNKPKSDISFALDLENKDIQMAYEAGYKKSKDTLFSLFHHADPTIRYIAVNAFASWSDSTAIDSIAALLKDSDENVRIGAAYSLGQIRNIKAESYLVNAFQKFDSLNNNQYFNATLLEAIGKCGSLNSLKQISSVKSYKPSDSIVVIGQAKAIFRFATRDIVSNEGTKAAVNLVVNTSYPYDARLYAANYLARAKGIELKNYADTLINAFNAVQDHNINLSLALAITKSKTTSSFAFLESELGKSNDQGIRYNLISNLKQYTYANADTIAFQYLKDNNPVIAREAGSYLVQNGNANDSKKYFNYFLDPTTNKAAHIEILAASNKHMPYTFSVTKTAINNILKDSLLRVSDIYRKTDIIDALSYDVTNFVFIRDATQKAPDKVIQVAGLASFTNILASPYFSKVYKSNYIPYKKLIFSYLINGLMSGDVGLVSTAAVVLRDPILGLKTFYPSDSLFKIVLKRQKLPENVEAYKEVAKTLSYWNGLPEKQPQDIGFRMLDWAVLNNISDSTTCEISTSKGVIKILMLPSKAPMTVANWVELVKRNYFNGKNFHRIVQNFVAQGGCNRGDGFGATNYTIRSEFSRIYYDREGMVGMASSGADTESAQFFITTAPAPHLDGRYTIFAKVIKGMDVVKRLQRGDKINKVTLK